jgi:hypothetical protein
MIHLLAETINKTGVRKETLFRMIDYQVKKLIKIKIKIKIKINFLLKILNISYKLNN